MQDFKDFPGVALVVGGSGGIGSEICRLFAEKGCDSCIFGLSLQIGHHHGLLGDGLIVSRLDQFEIKGTVCCPLAFI